MTTHTPVPASFRDPAGRLFLLRDRALRIVNPQGAPDVAAFLASRAARRFLDAGAVVATRAVDGPDLHALLRDPAIGPLIDASNSLVLEHDRIPFPSFPYEWPAEMLHAAAVLTLDLARELLPEGIGLKDAAPYNVLFRGPNPVFVDLLSFERRNPSNPAWLPYAQFVRAFLLPLLLNRHYALALDQLLLTRRDGLEPEEVYRWIGPLRKLTPPYLSLVSIPRWISRRHDQDDSAIYRERLSRSPEEAQFILRSLLAGLRRKVARLTPPAGKSSTWSDYMSSNNNYSADHFAVKERFVETAMRELRPRRVLDVGCNNGFFSSIAARSGAAVVAIDSDPVVAGDTWRRARAESLDILPLVVNLTRPTPAVGWRNGECASFLDRARGTFDAVLMLAVLHHIVVTERVPLDEVADLAADLTTQFLIIEFIAPQDTMFQRLTRGRDHLYADLSQSRFEDAFRRRFTVERVAHVEGSFRWLYLLRKC